MEHNSLKFNANMETTLRDIVSVLFRHKFIIIAFSFILIPFVYVKQELVTPVYKATVTLMVSGVKLTESTFYREAPTGGMGLTTTLTKLVSSKIVVERVVNALKLYERPLDFDEMQNATRLRQYLIKRNVKELELSLNNMTPGQRKETLFELATGKLYENITVDTVGEANLFTISVKDFNPAAATIIANSLSRSYLIFDLEQKVAELQLKYGERHSNVLHLQNYIKDMYKTLDGKPLPDIEAIGPASVKIVGQARITDMIGPDNKISAIVVAFLIGLFGGISLSFILDYFSQTFLAPNDIEKSLNIPCLGSIPKRNSKDKLIIHDSNPGNDHYQFYQNISYHLDFSIRNNNIKSILITDIEASEDTAAVIANVGFSLAHKNKNRKVLIIDANLRNPLISNRFDIAHSPGLIDVLEGNTYFENAVHDMGFNVNVLSAGQYRDDVVPHLDSSMMADVIKRAKDIYDVILISSLDLRKSTDTVKLSSLTDAFVLVINAEKARRFIVNMAIAPLKQKKVQILGAILNNRRMVIPKMIYKRI